MITWCSRALCCYSLGQNIVVTTHFVLHSFDQSSPRRFPKPLHLENGGKKGGGGGEGGGDTGELPDTCNIQSKACLHFVTISSIVIKNMRQGEA